MGRPGDYSSRQHQGRKVPQVHRLRPFVMLTPYPKSAACSTARHKHFPENFRGVVIPLRPATPLPTQHTHADIDNSLCCIPRTIQLFLCVENEREMWGLESVCVHKTHRPPNLHLYVFIHVFLQLIF